MPDSRQPTSISERPHCLEIILASPAFSLLDVLKNFSKEEFGRGCLLALSLILNLSARGLRMYFSTRTLVMMKQKAIGIGYQRSEKLAKCSGFITMVLFMIFSSLKVFQSTLGGSHMSGFQNHIER